MAEVNKGTQVPGEEEESSLSPQADPIEEKARAKGWRPEDDWKGDAEDWVPAKEFLGRQKLYDKIKDLKGDLFRQTKGFEREMANISEYIAKQEKSAYDRALRDLESQKRAARREGDHETLDEVEDAIDDLKEQAKEAEKKLKESKPTRPGGPTPEFQEWKSKNKWFGENAEMTADAIAFGTGYAAAHPEASQSDVLEATEKKVRKMYAEEFETPARKKSAADVEGGEGRQGAPSGKRKTKITVHDLDETERKIMRDFVKRGVLKKKAAQNKVTEEEQFLIDYSK
jgi:hypothetical protein